LTNVNVGALWGCVRLGLVWTAQQEGRLISDLLVDIRDLAHLLIVGSEQSGSNRIEYGERSKPMSIWSKVKRSCTKVTNVVSKPVKKAGNDAIKQARKAAKVTVKAATEAGDVMAPALDVAYKIGASNPMIATSVALGKSVARGDSLLEAAHAVKRAGVKSAKESLQYAQIVAPFVPGIGSGAAAALAAGGALASGKPISDAMIDAACASMPGGTLAQTAFKTGVSLAKGKNITAVALQAARDQIPGGKEGKIAFDTAVALSRGQSLQQIAKRAGTRVVSPYAADAGEFVRAVKADINIQTAALSRSGRKILMRSKRAAEINGRSMQARRIENIARRKAHVLKLPKRLNADIKKAKLEATRT
jgi:hypothetical protein